MNTETLKKTDTRRDQGKTETQKQTVVSVDREHRDGCAS